MKHMNELQPIITAIFCINQTSEQKDADIAKICDYAFRTFYGANTNLLTLCCVGKTKDDLIKEIMQLLSDETGYIKYLEEYSK